MSIGITGRYEVYALLQPIIGWLDINEAARIDNDIRKGYFHTDADAYAYFESKFESCAVDITSAQRNFPYDSPASYPRGYIDFLRVTIEQGEDIGILILMKV